MKEDNELESLCRKCGLCCHIKIGLTDGTYIVHPAAACKFLQPDGLCGIYKKRFKMNPSGCFTRNEMIKKDFLLPEGCPYTRLRKGYKPARVVSEKEFMSIMITEELLGNKNILLVELGLLKPNLIKRI